MSRIKLSQIKPVRGHILVRDMNFGEQKTAGGIVLRSDDGKSEGVRPRWCRVFAVGAEQKDIKIGDWLLIEHGRWTRGLEVEEEDGTPIQIHRIDETGILLVSDDRPEGAEFGSFVSPTHGSVHSPEDFVRM